MKKIMPVIFVSHGAPTLLIDGTKAEQFFKGLAGSYDRPKGILVVSGHWETTDFTLSTADRPETIYDFYGFPDELYRIKYPAKGDALLGHKAADLLRLNGFKAETADRGLDHGAWVPLLCMYPEADIPVVQLGMKKGASADELVRTGEALRSLREEGILILASGSATHNLRDFGRYRKDSAPAEYAVTFDRWLQKCAEEGDIESLKGYRLLAPDADRNHPTDDHFSPFLIAAGASFDHKGVRIHDEFSFGVISLAAYIWEK